MWRKKLVDSNELQWTDLRLSDFIDCGGSEKMVYKCNPLPSIRCLSFLISKKYTLSSHIYTLVRPLSSYHTYTHIHTNIYCHGISIRLWALVSCSYCKAEGLNETIIRTLKSRGPQMIREERTREKDKEKKGMRVKIPTIEPIQRSKPLLRAYFSPGGHCVFSVCMCVNVCPG